MCRKIVVSGPISQARDLYSFHLRLQCPSYSHKTLMCMVNDVIKTEIICGRMKIEILQFLLNEE